MVLTQAQTTAFFENANQMAIPNATVVKLSSEGISNAMDLSEFDKTSINQIADNLRRPGGRVVDPNDPNATIPTPPFVFGAKSQQRLLVASDAVRFYETIGRNLTASNLQWSTVLIHFKDLWKALVDRKNADEPDTPRITKALPIMKWTEAFVDHLNRCIGVRTVPLSYVIRNNVTRDLACPPLKTNQPYSELHGSVQGDLIARASHTHGLYNDDNATVYYKLEEACRTTTYAASIAPFQKKKDGRSAFLALKSQYAGDDKWHLEIKKQDEILHQRKWRGQSNFTLEKFVQLHRVAFVSMQACVQHVPFQLPTEFTRVGYLLDGIECDDPPLQAAIARVNDDHVPPETQGGLATGKRNDFEAMATYLLPKDPVARRRAKTSDKRSVAEISSAELDEGDQVPRKKTQTMTKQGIGATGVHLRYHTPDEYTALSRPQRTELAKWRLLHPHIKTTTTKKRKKTSIASAVAKGVSDAMQSNEKEAAEKQAMGTSRAALKALIISAFDEEPKKPAKMATVGSAVTPSENVAGTATITLASILKQAKNAK